MRKQLNPPNAIRRQKNNKNSNSKQMNKNSQLRSKTLRENNAWCYQRASHLSLTGHDKEAQALTEEHMESLKNAKPEETLWVGH